MHSTNTFEDLPLEIKLRLLCTLPNFDTLITLLQFSDSYRSVFLLYPRSILLSIHENGHEDYIVTALALLSLYLRLRPTKPDKDPENLADLAERYGRTCPGFLEEWEEQGRHAEVEPRMEFWIDAVCHAGCPLERVSPKLGHKGFGEEALDNLINAHVATRGYARAYAEGELSRFTRDCGSELLPGDRRLSEPTDEEWNRIFHAFYRLWVLCHLLQNYEIWSGSGGAEQKPNNQQFRDMDTFFEALPSIWDALAMRSVYVFLRESLKRFTTPFLHGEWYAIRLKMSVDNKKWNYTQPREAENTFPSSILLSLGPSLLLYDVITSRCEADYTSDLLRKECIFRNGVLTRESQLEDALILGYSKDGPQFYQATFQSDRVSRARPEELEGEDKYKRLRVPRRCAWWREAESVRANMGEMEGDAAVWDDWRLEMFGLHWPAREEQEADGNDVGA